MRKVLLLGAGKIGRMIARFLTTSNEYEVLVGDADPRSLERIREQSGVETIELDAGDAKQLAAAMRGRTAVISALNYLNNPVVAQAALEAGISYFDLTEDLATTGQVGESPRRPERGRSSCRSAGWRRASCRSSPSI